MSNTILYIVLFIRANLLTGIQRFGTSTVIEHQRPSPAALVLTLVLTTFVRIGQPVCLSQRTPHPTLLMILDEGSRVRQGSAVPT